jgi:hypothetical protein
MINRTVMHIPRETEKKKKDRLEIILQTCPSMSQIPTFPQVFSPQRQKLPPCPIPISI